MKREVRRLTAELVDDFFRLHSEENGCGWCCCVAWWVPTWEGWGDRSANENRALREKLFKQGEYDGYLLYVDDEPVGWCQVGPRDRLEKLVGQFSLAPDPSAWAITCFLQGLRLAAATFVLDQDTSNARDAVPSITVRASARSKIGKGIRKSVGRVARVKKVA